MTLVMTSPISLCLLLLERFADWYFRNKLFLFALSSLFFPLQALKRKPCFFIGRGIAADTGGRRGGYSSDARCY